MAEAKKPTKAPATKKKTAAEEKAILEKIKKADLEAVDNEAQDIIEEAIVEEVKTTKAGKNSAKAQKEAAEKVAKEERKAANKAADAAEAEKPKQQQNPPRSKFERKGKGYRKVAELIEKDKSYSLAEALELATKTNPAKFDATVELHIRLGVDPRQADQNLRDIVVLPAGTGKTVRVAVVADPDGVAAAKKAGADIAGSEEFLQQLDKGVIDFDVLVSTPAMMAKLGKYARLLGPKGLMPNPKSGTVTTEVAKAVTEAKAGRVEYRVDSTGIVHLGIGKVSFGKDKLLQNAKAVMSSIKSNKPSSLKSTFVKSIFVSSSMGPSIIVDITEL